MPSSNIIAIICPPIVEWYVVKFESKNGHHKDVCLQDIGLRAQNMLIILGSIVNIVGSTIWIC